LRCRRQLIVSTRSLR